MAAGIAQGILLVGNLLFLVNFYGTSCMILKLSAPAVFNTPAEAETHAS
jgi:hypothetical protein